MTYEAHTKRTTELNQAAHSAVSELGDNVHCSDLLDAVAMQLQTPMTPDEQHSVLAQLERMI